MPVWMGALVILSQAEAALPDLSTPDWEWDANTEYSYAGYETIALGDVEGDGFDDFAVQIDYYAPRIAVFHGTVDGPETFPREVIDLGASAYYDPVNSAGGDFDGDGYGDLAVGDGYFATNDTGIVRIYWGSPNGLLQFGGWSWSTTQAGAYLGWGVGAADVNGDGIDDLIAGAPGYDDGQDYEGGFFLFLGTTVGPGTTPTQFEGGDVVGAGFGTGVEGVGDVNGDGFEDVAVASAYLDNPSLDEGRLSVYHGRPLGLRTNPSKIWEPNQDDNTIAWYHPDAWVDGGDFNGDGYSDVIMGLPHWDGGSPDEGRAVAFYGSAGGLASAPSWQTEGNQEGADLGEHVTSLGDIDGDGYDDAAVSVWGYDTADGTDVGRIELFRGGPSGLEPYPAAALDGSFPYGYLGGGVLGAGDLNGDGAPDMVSSVPNLTDGEYNEGRLYAWFGLPVTEYVEEPFGGPETMAALFDHPGTGEGDADAAGCDVASASPQLAWLASLALLLRRRRC